MGFNPHMKYTSSAKNTKRRVDVYSLPTVRLQEPLPKGVFSMVSKNGWKTWAKFEITKEGKIYAIAGDIHVSGDSFAEIERNIRRNRK